MKTGPGSLRYADDIRKRRIFRGCAAACFATVIIVAAVLMLPAPRRAVNDFRLAVAFQRARLVAADPNLFAARLTAPTGDTAAQVARILSRTKAGPMQIGAALTQHAAAADGDTAARATGTAYFIAGDYEKAATAFESIRQRQASDWNDLAAAQLCAASQTREQERLAAALTAADRALGLRPRLAEARFNRAAILRAFGVQPVAVAHWKAYLDVDPQSAWAAIARREVAQQSPSEREVWKAASQRSDLTREELLRLTVNSPELARRYGEGVFLAGWAAATAANDPRAANEHLARARIIAAALQRTTGESLLSDSIVAIDRASPSRRSKIVEGYLLYRQARLALGDGKLVDALRDFRRAQVAFEAGASPMAAVAAFYVASAILGQDRPSEALELLVRMLETVRSSRPRHHALRAQIQYEIALAEAVQGHWSASLNAAHDSLAIYNALGERANAATSKATLSEVYDFLGNPESAWTYGVTALREATVAGDLRRARTILAALCRTEMRGRRWERARALAMTERELARFEPRSDFDADLFLRKAVAEWHVGARTISLESIAAARAAALRTDKTMQAKLLADIDGAAGTVLRPTNPRQAVDLLTSAIEFQKGALRSILLPELYLERGRAWLSINDVAAAARDFEAGIVELERQRRRVHDADLRAGIFADAAELFDEAVSLQLRVGNDAEGVLAYVERGRARAVLEQIEDAGEQIAPGPVPLEQIQRTLTAGTLLIEYVALPRVLLIILISADRIDLVTVDVPRRSLEEAAQRFADVLASGGESDDSLLYDSLIEPIAKRLEGVQAINVVVDQSFERVPFAALRPRGSKTFLIERYTLASSTSAAVFGAVQKSSRQRNDPPALSAMIFGNPTVSRDEFPTLVNLGGAEREVSLVARYYTRNDVLVGPAATARRFLSDAHLYDVIHFAGHAIVHRREPERSALLFAASPDLPGALTLRQIARMRFDSTRLVVLAACSTLRGRNAAVEGVPSIARGFLIAGVPAVVGTLWDIEDGEAAPLMRDFHHRVARGAPPADALRHAQIAAIRAGQGPSTWAAFALTGISEAPTPQSQPPSRTRIR